MFPQLLWKSSTSALIVTLGVSVSAPAGETCVLIDNGSFEDGLAGWTTEVIESPRGDSMALGLPHVADGTLLSPFMDEDTLLVGINVFATGQQDEGFGEAVVDVFVSQTVEATGPTLRFEIGGTHDATWWSEPVLSFQLDVIIEDSAGDEHVINIGQHTYGTSPACGLGVSLTGFFNHPISPEDVIIDLEKEAGVSLGDEITVTIHLHGQAIAPTTCDQAQWTAQLLLNNFQICGGPLPADLDGDGSVGPADLALLLGAWGRNPGHPADFDGDGSVTASDLAQLLGSWT